MRTITMCVLIWLLTGCEISSDPMGMTQRARIRADAAIQTQQAKSAAVIAQAQAEQRAREAEAQAMVDAEAERQAGLKHRYVTVAFVVPIALIILLAGGIRAMVVHWQGKIAFERACWGALDRPATPPTLPRQWREALAAKQCDAEWYDGKWYIVPRWTGQRLPEPISQRLLEGR